MNSLKKKKNVLSECQLAEPGDTWARALQVRRATDAETLNDSSQPCQGTVRYWGAGK